MSIVVQKYGGSSVADVSRIRQVAERVVLTSRQGHQVVVVVSAMGKTTDTLLALAKDVSPNPERRELDILARSAQLTPVGLAFADLLIPGVPAIDWRLVLCPLLAPI